MTNILWKTILIILNFHGELVGFYNSDGICFLNIGQYFAGMLTISGIEITVNLILS